MRRTLSATALVAVAVAAMGCASLTKLRTNRSGTAAAQRSCSACVKMCAVAGDAEKNPQAVEACQADCRTSCTED